MDSQDYPIEHFEQIARLSVLLRDLPALVQEHSYSYESFGSWMTVLRYKGVRIRIVFDGRDSHYGIQRSSARKPPDEWGDVYWEKNCESGEEIPLQEIVDAISKCEAAG